MEGQRIAAQRAMTEWLADKHELGRRPAKIECAGEFDLHEMHYYIFKYKKSLLGRWLLGVCGGYEPGETEHCGHVFSEMEPYDPADAQEKAAAMVEMIREYWMQRAQEESERRGTCPDAENDPEAQRDGADKTGPFVGFVLLGNTAWDFEKLCADLENEWSIRFPKEDKSASSEDRTTLAFDVDGMMAAMSLICAPIPDGEAERNAANNFLWKDGAAEVKKHRAHIMTAVLPGEKSAIEAGKLLVKLCDAASRQPGAIGVYTSGTVFQADAYCDAAQEMKNGPDELPVLDWIYFGIYPSEGGMNGYTYGMTAFGKDEIEVLGSRAAPADLYGFLFDVSYYVLSLNVTLRDGETIGFSERQKLPITRSKGVSVDGDSLKIAF
ncbi:DUF4261 domain-containing protein [Anaerotruncus rubiinfantis]|uniref:DUF4261 domain-containing protein n=1 Tax=Anaerotruncus rubiinfantis TaxID=1720200 RepID=UPI0018987C6C|nr:DUF4261 domain-containing protein [Anaerotruncus rubiinfantis]